MMISLSTELKEVKLTSFLNHHAKEFAMHANNKKIWNNLRDEFPHPYTVAHAAEYIDRVKSDPKTLCILFNGEAIGEVSLSVQDDIRSNSAMLGYWISEAFWGKGIASAAVKRITEYGLNDLKLNRIYARLFDGNIGSEKVLLKAGFSKEGHFKDAVFKNDAFLDQVQYAVVNSSEAKFKFKMEHIGISVQEPVKVGEWYRDVLNFELLLSGDDGEKGVAFIKNKATGVMIEFFKLPETTPLAERLNDKLELHIALHSENLDKDQELLTSKGAVFIEDCPNTMNGDRLKLFKDPWGNSIQLVQRAKGRF